MTSNGSEGCPYPVGDADVRLRHPVKERTRTDDVVVLLLDVPVDDVDNRNVIGFSTDGDRLWEIEPLDAGPSDDAPYVNLSVRDGELWAGNWAGYDCRVDLDTGSLVETKFTR